MPSARASTHALDRAELGGTARWGPAPHPCCCPCLPACLPQALDRWEQRLNATFRGEPYDVLDAALSDTISKFPIEVQPFRDMVEGMRMDLVKSRCAAEPCAAPRALRALGARTPPTTSLLCACRYQTFDELYEYCYRVAGTVGLMTMPVMGIDPKYKVRLASSSAAAQRCHGAQGGMGHSCRPHRP